MAATCVQGAFGQFAVKAGTGNVDFTTGTPLRMPFAREDFQCLDSVDVPDVIWGTRTEPSERARRGPQLTRGIIDLPVSPLELDTLLPLILGANEAANVFALAETVPTFAMLLDKVSRRYKYKDGVVNQAIFHGVQAGPGQPPNFVMLRLQCLFKDEDDATNDAFPAMTITQSAATVGYTFEDGVVTIDGTAREPMAWTIGINNHIDQRYVNSLLPVTNCPARRTVNAMFKFAADADHVALRKLVTAGVAASVALTMGSLSTTFAFACIQAPRKTPIITGKTESTFTLNATARGLSTTKELIVTNVSS
jgi:hypothetical protein